MEHEAHLKFDRAKKKVKEIRGFYNHIGIFVVTTIVIFVVRFVALPKLGFISEDEGFVDWLNWNTYLLPIIWILVLLVHGLIVYRNKLGLFKKWEERKIAELMENEEMESKSFKKSN